MNARIPIPITLIVALAAFAIMIGLVFRRITGDNHVYTCAEVLGNPPQPGYVAILPPGWSFVGGFEIENRDGHFRPVPDYRIWDSKHRQVCESERPGCQMTCQGGGEES